MPEKILIARFSDESSRPLSDILRDAGYPLLTASSLAQAKARLREFPALLLLDMAMARKDDGLEEWSAFVHDCRTTNIPCLLFASDGSAPTQMDPLLSAATGTLPRPGDRQEVTATIASQLDFRRLTYELNLTRYQLQEKEKQLQESMRSAAQIQQSLIPDHFPELDELHFAARFLPCGRVGGDLFNVLQLDEETVMVYVMDVSGHGVSSAMLTVSVYQSLSLHTGRIVKRVFVGPPYYKILTPAEVLTELDQEYPFERFEMFFTISYLLIDTGTGKVRYSSAGHPPPALVRSDGSMERLREGGTIIGMGGDAPSFAEGETVLHAGDRLYLYSDGVPDFMNAAGALYGEERLLDKLVELKAAPLDAACETLVEYLHAFGRSYPQQDDVTLLGLEYRSDNRPGHATRPPASQEQEKMS